ncbi:NAD(P)-binding domain-containing protein [Streptomyces sp. NPDC007369]|uniref:flavin-containing monooxygenase n=1 Tax=Streptomyces sp. NPDC007369 TaxID=3154589 RepID=UPI0033ED69D2
MPGVPATPDLTTQPRPVYVIGAGPGGLAAAAALRARGIRAVVVEKTDTVGSSWRGHYDRLHLHTTRRLSALPGLAMPRRFGRWVSRDNVVRYLEKYAEFHELELVTGVEVTRIEHAPHTDGTDGTPVNGAETASTTSTAATTGTATTSTGAKRKTERKTERTRAGKRTTGAGRPGSGGAWLLHATGGRVLTGAAVVVATGFNHTPAVPDWPGRDTYGGQLLHARDYRTPEPYTGLDVLVVGVGNTGAEIAVDLAEGGAARVRLAVRTAPHIVRRSTAGWPAQRSGILVRRLPVPIVDRISALIAKASVPDLSAYGLPRPSTGLYSRVKQGAIPVQDVGLIDAVRNGRVEPVAAVESFDGAEVVLADGSRITPDVVIAATGYRRALEGLVGHLDVLDERGRPRAHGARTLPHAPGLHFTGFGNPISGMFRAMALDAERIAKVLARRLGVRPGAGERDEALPDTGLRPVDPLA